MTDSTHKKCPDCGETKPASEWGKNKRVIGGLAAYCSACTSVRNRAQYVKNQARRIAEASAYRAANVEVIAERAQVRRVSPEGRAVRRSYAEVNRDRLRTVGQAWRAAHPNYSVEWRAGNPDRLAWERNNRDANRDRFNERARAQHANNPLVARRAKNKYRAAKKANGHIPYSAEQWLSKFEYWGRRCWICRADLSCSPYHIDHVKPLNKGGMDCLSNLRPACGSCNQSKRDRWPFNPLEATIGTYNQGGNRIRQIS